MDKRGVVINDYMIWIAIFVVIVVVGLILILKTEGPLSSAVSNLFGGFT